MVTPALQIKNAEKAVFYRHGKVKARQFERGDRTTMANGERLKFEKPLLTYVCDQDMSEFDKDRITVEEKAILVTEGAKALGRETDNQLFKEMRTAKPAADLNFGAASFTLLNAMQVCQALQAAKVPWDGNVFCPLPSLQWNQLLTYKQFVEAGYIGTDLPYAKATTMKTWNGVTWMLMVEEDPQDFYPAPSGTTQDLFMWHKSALGWGNHTEIKSRMEWNSTWRRDEILMDMKGCPAALQQGDGIIRFTTKSDGVLTLN